MDSNLPALSLLFWVCNSGSFESRRVITPFCRNSHCSNMRRTHAPSLIGIIGIIGGLMIVFPIEKVEPAIPTIKVPGPYPYETPVQLPAPPPTISESSVLPTPAPFPYRESSPSLSAAQDRDSRTQNPLRPLTAKAVREAAFKYN